MAMKVSVSIFRQDARVSAPSTDQLEKDDIGTRLTGPHVDLWDDTAMKPHADKDGNFLPALGRPQFDQVQAFTTVTQARNLMERNAKHDQGWAFEGQRLTVAPHMGEGANAYYVRFQEAVCFYSFHSKALGKTVHASQSADIVAHETGHAILDGMKPLYGQTFDRETKAFHEAFGDCTALLLAASRIENCQDALAEAGPDLAADNCLSRTAEEFGTAVRRFNSDPSDDKPYLRNARNPFVYQPPETLPPDGPRDELSAESHSFCEIFTGAFYDAIVNVFKSGEERTPEALSQAAEQMGRVLTLGTQMANPARARYHDVAQAMLAAEQALYGGQHHEALAAALTGRGLQSPTQELPALTCSENVLAELGLDPSQWTPQRTTTDADGFTILEYAAHEPMAVGRAVADVYGGLSLTFDPSGRLIYRSLDVIDEGTRAAEIAGLPSFRFSAGPLPAEARLANGRLERLPVFID